MTIFIVFGKRHIFLYFVAPMLLRTFIPVLRLCGEALLSLFFPFRGIHNSRMTIPILSCANHLPSPWFETLCGRRWVREKKCRIYFLLGMDWGSMTLNLGVYTHTSICIVHTFAQPNSTHNAMHAESICIEYFASMAYKGLIINCCTQPINNRTKPPWFS